ncbi:hypothetical protein F2P56_033837 [Juglans regia]|uniref:Uncharacterized protein n=1 Tax=Juglans regia TaxID=51240 RepID=A0A833WTT9_JUGRE|nr:hypothetical protein F2P56_033837 [Juglans regia]
MWTIWVDGSEEKRIYGYLHTFNHGLCLRKSFSTQLIMAYFDTKWAGCRIMGVPLVVIAFFLVQTSFLGEPSLKQHIEARSSIESKSRSLANTMTEVQWLQHLLQEIGLFLPSPPILDRV